jgi:integrase
VLKYKGILIEKGLAEATINRRLSAIKALVNYARRIGKCDWSLTDVKGEKVQPYRDTSGVSVAGFKKMAAIPSLDTLKGKRDYALLRLLWENALRGGEVSKANVGDFDPDAGKLLIYGKGRGEPGGDDYAVISCSSGSRRVASSPWESWQSCSAILCLRPRPIWTQALNHIHLSDCPRDSATSRN